MLTASQAHERLLVSMPELTLAEVEAELALINQNTILAEEESYLDVELWDKTSAINGISAEIVLDARDDIPEGGEVVLIKDNRTGAVVLFQPFDPAQSGLVAMDTTAANALGVANKSAMAEGSANARVLADLAAALA